MLIDGPTDKKRWLAVGSQLRGRPRHVGKQGAAALNPHFTPFVTKFGENGGAYSAAELCAYFAEYLRRGYTVFTADREAQEMKAALQAYL